MCPNAQGMADGEGFPDRSVAAQARDSLYSRGHLRRRQVELAEGNVELPVFLLAPPPIMIIMMVFEYVDAEQKLCVLWS